MSCKILEVKNILMMKKAFVKYNTIYFQKFRKI